MNTEADHQNVIMRLAPRVLEFVQNEFEALELPASETLRELRSALGASIAAARRLSVECDPSAEVDDL